MTADMTTETKAPMLREACEQADKWLRENVKASDRPATLDKLLMDALAADDERRKTTFPWALAARMMEAYADRLGCDGCNDYEIPDTPEHRALIFSNPDVSHEDSWRFRDGKMFVDNSIVAESLVHAMNVAAVNSGHYERVDAGLLDACGKAARERKQQIYEDNHSAGEEEVDRMIECDEVLATLTAAITSATP